MGPLPWPARTTTTRFLSDMHAAIDNTQASSEVCASKACFKCLEVKLLSEYYKHPATRDKHLNKCKSCTKADVKKDTYRKLENPDWVAAEQARHRDKYHRLGYREMHRPSPDIATKNRIKYTEKYPEKMAARNLTSHLAGKNGSHMHHWSYAVQDAKDLIKLNAKDHATLHRFIVYDQQKMAYRRKDNGELLATRELHESYAFEILQSIAA